MSTKKKSDASKHTGCFGNGAILRSLLQSGLILNSELTARQLRSLSRGETPRKLNQEQIRKCERRVIERSNGAPRSPNHNDQTPDRLHGVPNEKQVEESVFNAIAQDIYALAAADMPLSHLFKSKSARKRANKKLRKAAAGGAQPPQHPMSTRAKAKANQNAREAAAQAAAQAAAKPQNAEETVRCSSGQTAISDALANMKLSDDEEPVRRLGSAMTFVTPPKLPISPGSRTASSNLLPLNTNLDYSRSGLSVLSPRIGPLVQRAAIHTSASLGGATPPLGSIKPHPSSAYLLQASAEPVRLQSPQPLLIISDLNGTLVNKRRGKKPISALRTRPGLAPFLRYILDIAEPAETPYTQMPTSQHKNFAFMLWTSAMPRNAELAVSYAFIPPARSRMAAIWARDTLGLTPTEYSSKAQVYKRLQRVWRDDHIQRSHPGYRTGGRWAQHNTVLIDDSALKATTEPFNLIHIPELTNQRLHEERVAAAKSTDRHSRPEGSTATDAGVLRRVAEYLEEARCYADVSVYIRCNPFGTEDGGAAGESSGSSEEEEEAALLHNDEGLAGLEDELEGEQDGGVSVAGWWSRR